MNRLHLALLTLALATGPALAAQSAPPLPAWEQLTPAQRDLVIAPIRDRWNANPDTRARLFEHAQRWQQLSPGQRAKMRHGLGKWEQMDPQQRQTTRALFHAMRSMTPAQRKDLRERWRAMTPQQRQDWVRAHQAPKD
jgi:uncharacterized protein DUF3106